MEYIISALVVDDENSTRQILTKYIDWKGLGVSHVYDASDGKSALEIALSVKPQIIISDIKMPYMNGIEFAKHIRAAMPDCKFVFLSGYPDKEYLKSAIKLKATNFIEKPIDIDEISSLVGDLVAECMEDNKKNNVLMDFSEQQLIFNITSHISSDKVISSLINQKPYFATPRATFAMAVINLGVSMDSPRFDSYKEIIQKQFSKDHSIIGIRNSKLLVVTYALLDIDYATFTNKLSAGIKEISSTYTRSNLFASCDLPISSLSSLHDSYTRTVEGLSKCFFIGNNKLYLLDNEIAPSYQLDKSIFDKFENAFIIGNQNLADKIIHQLALTLRRHQNTPPEYIKNIFLQLTFSLINMMEHRNLCFTFNSFDVLETISTSQTLSEITDAFLEAMAYCFKCSDKADELSQDPVSRINGFLQANYKDPELNIAHIADHLNFASSYLCSIFKKSTGKTINQYLTTLRIEKAKDLLTFSNQKLYEIGNTVGYKDGKYFTKVFSKTTGISPKQYRERNANHGSY